MRNAPLAHPAASSPRRRRRGVPPRREAMRSQLQAPASHAARPPRVNHPTRAAGEPRTPPNRGRPGRGTGSEKTLRDRRALRDEGLPQPRGRATHAAHRPSGDEAPAARRAARRPCPKPESAGRPRCGCGAEEATDAASPGPATPASARRAVTREPATWRLGPLPAELFRVQALRGCLTDRRSAAAGRASPYHRSAADGASRHRPGGGRLTARHARSRRRSAAAPC
jgi:hypothetical protein